MSKTKKRALISFDMQFVTSTISTTLVLILLGLIVFFLLSADKLAVFVKENIEFSIVINDEIKEADLKRITQELSNAPYAKSVQYISKEEALKINEAALGTNPEEFLGYNPFQASFEVKLNAAYANSDSLTFIEKELKLNSNIRDIAYRQELINKMNSNIQTVMLILLILACVLLFISFALINNTIRLAIYSKRFLIHTMKLVGASWGFIRKPFIRQNMVSGFCAASIASIVLYGGYFLLIGYAPNISEVITHSVLAAVVFAVYLLGLTITYFSAYLSMNKYLQMDANSIYRI